MSLAQTLVRRLAQNIVRYRQTITYKRGVSTLPTSAHVYAMPSSTRFAYFLQTETSGWGLPAQVVVVAGDFLPWNTAPVASLAGTADTLVFGDLTYAVRRVERVQFGPIILKTLLFVARNA